MTASRHLWNEPEVFFYVDILNILCYKKNVRMTGGTCIA